ncbi:MAG: hypothetical protein KAT77_01530, partial [Nanoarchaeota archaeon]|nr:hypothetical protein [Nanoarchaeota archaeon]
MTAKKRLESVVNSLRRALKGPEFDLGPSISTRSFLKAAALIATGLTISSCKTLESLAQEGEERQISLGEELSILQHASEEKLTYKTGLSCAPYHSNILSYVSKNGSRELRDMDRFFLRYNPHPSKAESVDETVFNQNLLNRNGPAPFSTSFTWDRAKGMLAAYILSKVAFHDYELLHVKIGNSKRPKKIMPLCKIKGYI